jgi:hypothetical protein
LNFAAVMFLEFDFCVLLPSRHQVDASLLEPEM